MMRRLAIFCLLFSAACGSNYGAVDLTGRWPQATADYEAVTADWTRRGRLLSPLVASKKQVLEVFATLKSPEWRAAYADFLVARQRLPANEEAALKADFKRQHAEGYEVHLFVVVDDRAANDLHKGPRSSWRVALVDDKGREVRAKRISKDRRPRSIILEEFPHLTQFHSVYVARFPREIEAFHSNAKRLALKIGSQRGTVELEWRGR